MISCNVSSTNLNEQVGMLNEFFQSIFSPKQKFNITNIESENPILTNFNISNRKIQKVVDQIDVTIPWAEWPSSSVLSEDVQRNQQISEQTLQEH